jgi:hypothetical protein
VSEGEILEQEQAEQVESTNESAAGDSTDPGTIPGESQSQAPDQSDDLAAEVRALRERWDAQQSEAPSQEEEVDLIDYLAGSDDPDEGEYEGYEDPAAQGADPAQSEDQLLSQLDAYVNEAAQEAIQPFIEKMQAERRNDQLKELAAKHPDLKEPKVIEAVGKKLGAIADAKGDPSLRADPNLVELAYMAVKAEEISSSEKPANPGSGHVESGSISQPDSGESPEEQIRNAILKAGGAGDSDRQKLLG